MRRRAFLAWLGCLALWPRRAAAQPGTWRVMSRVNPALPGAVAAVDVRLSSQAAARARAAAERVRPGVVRATVHLCPHAAGEPASEWYNCKDDPRAQYEEA